MRRAFTLVELAIVLVIIGLLVGAVLVGRDLIHAASIRAQLSQIHQYKLAIRAFQLKYQGLPGDLSLSKANFYGFETANCTGGRGRRDGNGLIQASNGWETLQGYNETQLFWSDLTQSQMIKETFPRTGLTNPACTAIPTLTDVAGGNDYIGNYLPEARIGRQHFVYAYYSSPYTMPSPPVTPNPLGNGKNWFGIARLTGIDTICTNSLARLPVKSAHSMDQKNDDGYPMTGTLRAQMLTCSGQIPTWAAGNATDGVNSCFNTTTNRYSTNVALENPNCSVSIQF